MTLSFDPFFSRPTRSILGTHLASSERRATVPLSYANWKHPKVRTASIYEEVY